MLITIYDNTEIDLETVDHPLWWQKQGLTYTASGYGSKIPTTRMVRYKNRLRRIYCTVYSNIGTCWIVVDGKRITAE